MTGRKKCVECGGYLPDEIEPDTGVYCPRCGTGQHVTDGGRQVCKIQGCVNESHENGYCSDCLNEMGHYALDMAGVP